MFQSILENNTTYWDNVENIDATMIRIVNGIVPVNHTFDTTFTVEYGTYAPLNYFYRVSRNRRIEYISQPIFSYTHNSLDSNYQPISAFRSPVQNATIVCEIPIMREHVSLPEVSFNSLDDDLVYIIKVNNSVSSGLERNLGHGHDFRGVIHKLCVEANSINLVNCTKGVTTFVETSLHWCKTRRFSPWTPPLNHELRSIRKAIDFLLTSGNRSLQCFDLKCGTDLNAFHQPVLLSSTIQTGNWNTKPVHSFDLPNSESKYVENCLSKCDFYVINLDKRKDRLISFLEGWNKIQAKNPSISLNRVRAVFNSTVKGVGCALSHTAAIASFIQSGKDFGVIMEDDLRFRDSLRFVDRLSQVVCGAALGIFSNQTLFKQFSSSVLTTNE